MTEREWQRCADPAPMLEFARPFVNEAQVRLFACGCCRRVWHMIPDEHCRHAVAIAELFAYHHASFDSLVSAHRTALTVRSGNRYPCFERHRGPSFASNPAYAGIEPWPPISAAAATARTAAAFFTVHCEGEHFTKTWRAEEARERSQQAVLLRRFLDYPATPGERNRWSPVVMELALALRDGVPCNFALSDALLEHDRPELAQHFRLPDHPRNCWGFERILGE